VYPSAASSLRCLPSQLEEAEIDFVARRHQLCNRGVAPTPRDTNLNRAGAVVRRLLLWYFRNRETGAITVAPGVRRIRVITGRSSEDPAPAAQLAAGGQKGMRVSVRSSVYARIIPTI
jgi:hypothetical protein